MEHNNNIASTFKFYVPQALAYSAILSTVLSTSCNLGAYEQEQRRLDQQRDILRNVSPETVQRWIDGFEDAARKYPMEENRR